MGFRTVVVLNNDRAHEWEHDPKLGEKIWEASCYLGRERERFQYGQIVEQVHADVQTVALLDGYGGRAVAHDHWHGHIDPEEHKLKMLKRFAAEMGYSVRKKPQKKATK